MKSKVGIALGGGGARGLAHVGVLKALEEERIPIYIIAGTSMGSIIGAMYAQYPDVNALIHKLETFFSSQDYESLGLKYIIPKNDQNPSFLNQLVKDVTQRIVINIAHSRTGIIKTERLAEAVALLIDDGDIEDTQIPFGCAATDLNSGQTILFQRGNIREAVTISSSIPGFIPPHKWDGRYLTDGGVTAPVPIDEAREMGADVVIGVSVDANNIQALDDPHILDIISRADQVRGKYLSRYQLSTADVQLHPHIEDAHWSELLRYREFIDSGERETREKLPQIRNILRKKNSIFRKLFS
ncbi:MAG: patatin-like phospholipase family protein [Candidatus Marinimicrobia bacterium]|nr:patatin-like phospholipase family protein [Candidatus Neomarinimicrobiota bacterium]